VHFTLNRADKGTDHAFSLEPEGLKRLCNDLRRFPVMIGSGARNPEETNGFVKKFGKSIYTTTFIDSGYKIKWSDLGTKFVEKAPKNGICSSKINDLPGKKLNKSILCGKPLMEADIEPPIQL